MSWTGFQEGYITAEIMHDWNQRNSAGGSDLVTAVSKKASVPVGAWDVVDLEPELVHPVQHNKHSEHEQGVHAWQVAVQIHQRTWRA